MTVNDAIQKIHDIDSIIGHYDHFQTLDGFDEDTILDLLEEYKLMLGDLKIKE